MNNLALDFDRGSHILPASQFANGQHVTIAHAHVGIGFARHGLCDLNAGVLTQNLLAIFHGIAREVGGLGIGATLKSSREPDQVGRTHILT